MLSGLAAFSSPCVLGFAAAFLVEDVPQGADEIDLGSILLDGLVFVAGLGLGSTATRRY